MAIRGNAPLQTWQRWTRLSLCHQVENTRVWTDDGLCYHLNGIGSDIVAQLSAAPLSVADLLTQIRGSYTIEDPAQLNVLLDDLLSKRILCLDRPSS